MPCRRELLGEHGGRQPGVEWRGDGDGDRPGPIREVRRASDARQDRARQLQHQRRVFGGETAEGIDAEAGEGGLAQGDHGRRSGGSFDQADLADDLTATDLPDMVPMARDGEAAADDEVAGVGLVALGEQGFARLEVQPVGQLHDLGGDAAVDREQLDGEGDGTLAVDAAADELGDLRQPVGVRLEPLAVGLSIDASNDGRRDCPDGGRARALGERGDLAQRLAGPNGGDPLQCRRRAGSRTSPRRLRRCCRPFLPRGGGSRRAGPSAPRRPAAPCQIDRRHPSRSLPSTRCRPAPGTTTTTERTRHPAAGVTRTPP